MTVAPPRLRRDLTVSQQQSADGPLFIVKDPVSGEYFRFHETEQFITAQLDGDTPLDVVRQRTEEHFGASLSPDALDGFLRSLGKKGLLESSKRKTVAARGLRGSPLYLRLPLFDPDKLLDRLVHRVRHFFTPHFVSLSAALIVLAALVAAANWLQASGELAALVRLSTIPPLLTIAFLVASAHEFAHGLTCKRFGGQVHEMGFMLIYFQPAFYCNVGDSWLFPERRQRLWVGLAGPYFELFIWALAVLVWHVSDIETTVHRVALLVMAVSGLNTLLNFNPFIKLDGYYILSDWLGMPNLRAKAFRYVGGLAERLVDPGAEAAPALPRRERRVYLWYGIGATAVSLALLAWVTMTVGGYVFQNHQPVALALLGTVVGVRFRRRVRKLFGKPSPADEPSDDKADRKESSAKTRRTRWMVLAAAVVALLILGSWELRIGGAFTVLPEENADVRAQTDGIIEHIAVDEGQRVGAGDLIARLENHALSAELGKTGASIKEARAILRKLETGATDAEVDVVAAGVARAENRLEIAHTKAGRLRAMAERELVSRNELDDAVQLVSVAESDLAEARGRLELLRTRTRVEDLEGTRARLELLETQRRFLEGEVRELNVLSPVAGIVATPSRQLREMERQMVTRGALIAKVYEFGAVTAQIVVSEKDIADVRVGQDVVLRARAHPSVEFRGTVTAIATAADGSSLPGALARAGVPPPGGGPAPGQQFMVTARIENPSLLLKPGMSGHAKVLGGQRRIAGLIARRVSRTFNVEFWSWW